MPLSYLSQRSSATCNASAVFIEASYIQLTFNRLRVFALFHRCDLRIRAQNFTTTACDTYCCMRKQLEVDVNSIRFTATCRISETIDSDYGNRTDSYRTTFNWLCSSIELIWHWNVSYDATSYQRPNSLQYLLFPFRKPRLYYLRAMRSAYVNKGKVMHATHFMLKSSQPCERILI